MNKAVFLDRDGTINVEKDHLYRIEDFEFIEGAPQAIKKLNDAGYLVVVITNQAGVGRGLYTEKEVEELHKHIDNSLADFGAKIDAYYYCTHHPVHGIGEHKKVCSCRKPEPGMLLAAAKDWNIDLKNSYFIGDTVSDMEAGIKAGVKTILVETGYGAKEKQELKRENVNPIIVKNLFSALDQILI